MPKKIRRPASEYAQIRNEHLNVLFDHCKSYDEGKRHYASEISTNLRVLLYNTPQSHSLLSQLNEESTHFFDTSTAARQGDKKIVYVAPASGFAYCTVATNENKEPYQDWHPSLHIFYDKKYRTQYESWWTSPVFYIDGKNTVSRRFVIKSMANSDRGAHVSPEIEEVYFKLTRESEHGISITRIEGDAISNPSIANNPALASSVSKEGSGMRIAGAIVRQIAHEVLITLHKEYESYNLPYEITNNTMPFVRFLKNKP